MWEWTEDCWNDSNNGNPGDGRARTTDSYPGDRPPANCNTRVVRGGSWVHHPQDLRSARRVWWNEGLRQNGDIGFRVAITLSNETIQVQEGDTLYGISKRYGVSLAALIEINGLAHGATIKPGQQLVLPAGAPAAEPIADVALRPPKKGVD